MVRKCLIESHCCLIAVINVPVCCSFAHACSEVGSKCTQRCVAHVHPLQPIVKIFHAHPQKPIHHSQHEVSLSPQRRPPTTVEVPIGASQWRTVRIPALDFEQLSLLKRHPDTQPIHLQHPTILSSCFDIWRHYGTHSCVGTSQYEKASPVSCCAHLPRKTWHQHFICWAGLCTVLYNPGGIVLPDIQQIFLTNLKNIY